MKLIIKKLINTNNYIYFFLRNLKYFFNFYIIKVLNAKNYIDFSSIDFFTKNKKKNIILFMPEFIFDSHSRYALKLFDHLSSLGKYNILFIKCFNHFTDCMAKKYNSDINKKYLKVLCNNCNKNFIRKISFIKNVINLEEISSVNFDQSFKSNKNFTSDKIEDFKNFTYQNIEMAKFSFYDYFIINKKNKLNLSEKEFVKLREIISNNIKLVDYFDFINSKIDISHIFMIDEYSCQSTLRRWAENKKIKTFFFQASPSKEEILEINNHKSWTKRNIDCIAIWNKYKNLNLSQEEIAKVYKNLILRTQGIGGHIFSTNFKKNFSINLLKKLNLSNDKKTIGLFTSSSDEEKAITENMQIFYPDVINEDAFKDQWEWIEETINWVEQNQNLQLIIGIHPRLYKTLYSREISPELAELKIRYLNRNYKYNNIKIIWPELGISTYNIFEVIDVAVVAWSSLANELALMGIPVITGLEGYFRITPNFDGIVKAKNKDIYFKEIAKKVDSNFNGLSISTLINSIKWFSLLSFEHEFRADKTPEKFIDLNKILDNKTTILNENFLIKEMNKNLNTDKKQAEALKVSISQLINNFINDNNKTKLIKRLKKFEIQLN